MVAPNVFGSSVQSFLDVTLRAPGILFDRRCVENLCIPGVPSTDYNLSTWSYFIAHVVCLFAPLSTARLGGQFCDKEVDAQGNKMGSVGAPWRGIRVRVIALEMQQVLHIQSVCLQPQLSRRQSACAVLCCHFWPVRFYRIFGHYLTKDAILGGKVIENKTCVLIFCTAFG